MVASAKIRLALVDCRWPSGLWRNPSGLEYDYFSSGRLGHATGPLPFFDDWAPRSQAWGPHPANVLPPTALPLRHNQQPSVVLGVLLRPRERDGPVLEGREPSMDLVGEVCDRPARPTRPASQSPRARSRSIALIAAPRSLAALSSADCGMSPPRPITA